MQQWGNKIEEVDGMEGTKRLTDGIEGIVEAKDRRAVNR